jgi:hypothetical protein
MCRRGSTTHPGTSSSGGTRTRDGRASNGQIAATAATIPASAASTLARKARAVTAGTLDADQGNGPEPAQPAEQPGVAGRRDRELLDAEQPADGIQRGGDMRVGVGDPHRR